MIKLEAFPQFKSEQEKLIELGLSEVKQLVYHILKINKRISGIPNEFEFGPHWNKTPIQLVGKKSGDHLKLLSSYFKKTINYLSLIKTSSSTYFNEEICERKSFNYPPFCKLIKIIIKSKRKDLLDIASFEFAALLRKTFSNRILGPEYPNVSRVKNFYIKNLLLKIETTHSFSKAKEILFSKISILKEDNRFKSIQITLDVDPF